MVVSPSLGIFTSDLDTLLESKFKQTNFWAQYRDNWWSQWSVIFLKKQLNYTNYLLGLALNARNLWMIDILKCKILYVSNRHAKFCGYFWPYFLHDLVSPWNIKKTLLQEYTKSLFIKPVVPMTLNTIENPHDGYSKFCFQGKVWTVSSKQGIGTHNEQRR